MCVEFGNVFFGFLGFLMKDVDVVINLFLRYKVIGKCFDCNLVYIIFFGWFWYSKSFEDIVGLFF